MPGPTDPPCSGANGPARRPTQRWADLGKRALSAAVLAPFAIACLWLGDWWWALLVALAAGGMAAEWVWLTGGRVLSRAGALAVLAVLAAVGATAAGQEWFALAVLAAAFPLARRLGAAGMLAAGIPYVGLAAVALVWLRGGGEPGRDNLLFLLLVVWAADIGAYLAGRLLGGPRLAPRVSPSKTWSGAAGGLVAAMLAGLVTAEALHGGVVGHALAEAMGIALASQVGDLLESALKRHYGVKDSGRLIPGHGGLLDRLDGMLAAAPVAALLALAVGRGVWLWQ